MKKISLIILIVAILVSSISVVSFAQAPPQGGLDQKMEDQPQKQPAEKNLQNIQRPEKDHPDRAVNAGPNPAPSAPQEDRGPQRPQEKPDSHHDSTALKVIAGLLLIDLID